VETISGEAQGVKPKGNVVSMPQVSSLPQAAGHPQATASPPQAITPAPQAGYVPVKYTPGWTPGLRNERNFEVMMDILLQCDGDMGAIIGEAGRGKTEMISRYVGRNQFSAIRLLCLEIWDYGSPVAFLQGLLTKLGVVKPPGRPAACAQMIIERLVKKPMTVFLDEADMIPSRINTIRQLAEASSALFVLIGEGAELYDVLTANGRTWSRVSQLLHFEAVSIADIITYARERTGLDVSPEAAAIISESPGGGDWRVIRRITVELVGIANSKQSRVVTEDMVRLAVKMGVTGQMKTEAGRQPGGRRGRRRR